MARPRKRGVEYFSHDTSASSGKTMFTLESQFGNDGYAFWFKLLETLGTQEDLCFRAENPADWFFLVAKTRVAEETATTILNLLAALGAIDAELWEHKVIWSQNFVDRLSDVYEKRTTETPQKPSFRPENSDKPDISAPKSTQSKVKESKPDNITSSSQLPVGRSDKQIFDSDSMPYKAALYLDKQVCERAGKKPADERTLQRWALSFDRLNRIDGATWDEIGDVLAFSQQDSFWQTNILSGDKFRKQYTQLKLRMKGSDGID